MNAPAADQVTRELATLDVQLKIVLPEEYQQSYETLQPVPMRSAPLQFDADGRVAWDRIWGSFCDLAIAGGPPHKGALLEPGTAADITADPDRYDTIVDEICRGLTLTTDLMAVGSASPGWVRVDCYSETMADWLLRAIVMENVAARADGRALELPAAPHFRLDKEIKNVVTVMAKTCHYWTGHMPKTQKESIAILFASLRSEFPLVAPVWSLDDFPAAVRPQLVESLRRRVFEMTGWPPAGQDYAGWCGVEVGSVRAAIWIMRALAMRNVLARREGTVLFLPLHPRRDPQGDHVAAALTWSHRLAHARGMFQ